MSLLTDDLTATEPATLDALAAQVEAAVNSASPEEIGRLRARCIEVIAGHPAGRKDPASVAAAVRVVELVLGAGWNDQPAGPAVVIEAERVGGSGWTGLLAALLLAPAWQIESLPNFNAAPLFLWRILAIASFRVPAGLTELGQLEAIARLRHSRLRELVRMAQVNPGAAAVREAAAVALAAGDLQALAAAEHFAPGALALRGLLRAAFHRRREAMAPLALPRAGRRLKLGVVAEVSDGGRSLRCALPAFDHLDGTRFEVELFLNGDCDPALGTYLASREISIRPLGADAAEKSALLQTSGLDIALVVLAESALPDHLSSLLADRIAPLQGALGEFGFTSGAPELDFLLTSGGFEPNAVAFSERPLVVPVHGLRLLPLALRGEARQGWTRADLGFSDAAVVFASAAPFGRLSPEWADRAARILRELPEGRLLIHSGAAADADAAGMQRLCSVLQPALVRHGIEPSRLMLSNEPLGGLAEVGALLRVADFYLDSYPLSDAEGCKLALAAGTPLLTTEAGGRPVSWAEAAVRALGLDASLVARAEDIVVRAVQLGRNASLRIELRQQLDSQMLGMPAFQDPLAHGEAVAAALEAAFDVVAAEDYRGDFRRQSPLQLTGPALVDGALEEPSILLESGLPGEALPRLVPFFAAHPANPRVRSLYYSSLIQSGGARRALAGLDSAAERGIEGADTARMQARAHLWLGHRQAAMNALRTSLQFDPKHPETWTVLAEIAQSGGHHAITAELDQLRAGLAPAETTPPPAAPRKCLYFSPVGRAGKPFLRQMVNLFPADQFDFLVIAYDDTDFSEFGARVEVIRDRGHKWRFIKKYLSPEKVAEYDYVFMWDDDLDPVNFEPTGFVEILRRNRIDIAQPSLTADSFSFHPITVAHPGPVGRLTNFVEIMCPVYSSAIWPSIYPYIEPEVNELGWGYDLIPLGRKAIVDCMSVRHTRPGQSANAGAAQQSAVWCARHQIVRPALVNLWSLS